MPLFEKMMALLYLLIYNLRPFPKGEEHRFHTYIL